MKSKLLMEISGRAQEYFKVSTVVIMGRRIASAEGMQTTLMQHWHSEDIFLFTATDIERTVLAMPRDWQAAAMAALATAFIATRQFWTWLKIADPRKCFGSLP